MTGRCAVAVAVFWLLAAAAAPAAAFDLFARHEVTAQFATPDGKPMADAEVRVFGPDDPTKVVETGRTDAQGKFTFPADRDGFWTAEAHGADQVARVMIRVGSPPKPEDDSPPSPPLMIAGLAALLAVAVGVRVLRKRARRSPR